MFCRLSWTAQQPLTKGSSIRGVQRLARAFLPVLVCLAWSCKTEQPTPTKPPTKAPPTVKTTPPVSAAKIAGRWRATLTSPGGELPFILDIGTRDASDSRAEPPLIPASIENGDESIEVGLSRDGKAVVITMDVYDARIDATIVGNGSNPIGEMVGKWTKTASQGSSSLPFRATRTGEEATRFLPAPKADSQSDGSVTNVDGRWKTVFTDADGVTSAVGEFKQSGEQVHGTFLTATGDYRYLAGDLRAGTLRLSTFDGAHAFLFVAHSKSGELHGDFWSRDSYHATFVAKPMAAGAKLSTVLPSPLDEVRVQSADRKVRFSLADHNGKLVSSTDPRFAGKVVLIDIFGTWCPNCNDAAPVLSRLHRQHHKRGLEVVGLAFEFTGEVERDRKMLAVFAAKHDINYPLLLAGVSDKAKASAVLPDLSAIKSFPTTVFVGRDGRVAKIHSGFAGPGTGEHYTELVAEFEQTVESLLTAKSK